MLNRWVVLTLAGSAAACGGSTDSATNGDAGRAVVDSGGSGSPNGDSGPTNTGHGGPMTIGTSGKLDLLFMVDNSASMGDKQQYLSAAIPDLVSRLVQPNCLKADGVTVDGPSSPDGMGTCPAGDTVEFSPVHDMHLGIVTSSLGPRGGDLCSPTAMDGTLNAHNDDRGELIDRGGATETGVPDMTASNFLDWFPSTTSNAGKSAGTTPTVTFASTLEADFSDLVAGVHQGGCGVESQLEAWYRFLIQPDPYSSIAVSNGAASWADVDTTILQQRRDFLRPDSAVAIIDLSDENDSEIDVRSLGQTAYGFMSTTFDPPRGTMACSTAPGSTACTSCAIDPSDPSCANGDYAAWNDWGFNPNLRHVHMKAKYGVDPQFPISRYVNGLTSTTVPDREGEYPSNASMQMTANYVGTPDCTNPLFAAALPDGSLVDKATLCNLPSGTRSPGLVFYAHIGGVPSSLLHFVPNDALASTLSPADWVKILGNDPDTYDYSGIDPHMIESYQPRTGLPGPTSADNADPSNGREWVTDSNPANGGNFVDLQFACTFPLTTPRDCTDPANAASCDCPTATGTTWDKQYTPPVCGGSGSLDASLPQTTQIAAKAYPTIREIELAQKMGANGVLASICPIHPADDAMGDDPLYGYRPAVTALVDHLRVVLTN
jgi:hypothetical protein